MPKTVVLDSTPLGRLCDPRTRPGPVACRRWVADMLAAGHRFFVPEIADYEIRRELLRLGNANSIAALDALAPQPGIDYLPLTRDIMRRAAELWAFARQTGQPTAGDNTVDADMILIAQAESLNDPGAVIATGNVGHLARFFPADLWSNIVP